MKNSNFVTLKSFVSVENLTVAEVGALIERAEYFKNGGARPHLTQPVYVTNMFFENSSRTHTSFEMAERKLGLTVIPFDAAHSSTQKGETLYDTSLIMAALGIDLEVIRHSENEYYEKLIHPNKNQHLNIGVINAGDGSGQHPSQCLLDMMTIHEHFGHFKDLKVAIVGDITNSRVAKSNMELLTRLGAKVYFSGPDYWYDKQYDKYGEYLPIDELVAQMDVMMLLRVQHERHAGDPNEAKFDAKKYHDKYGINQKRYNAMKDDAIIMHPGPINHDVELSGNLVEAPKCRFVRQMENGVFMRMAMIEAVMRGRNLGGLS
ncbi:MULTISPECIES: aspartate carbamoyltransferase catalytic subunit [Lactobacillus]|uniref:aspartate carbamoyltransferase catalytic subunit n=1 Tax=Lactobacillus TaxID=1578 RepID=UPI00165021DB|nr:MULTISPECIES: aspartate carbamoyltransferase catalytic subunit [Lactobacillus]MEB3365475.1 aspartate carbamoyltransferase catalytic subunit [Lactobacillus sp. R2/2]MBC6350496.1 aspartate carbamoyltransferase catalytic subunit [Lactobacillus melliventris]MBH9989555.1 aspartate carbamoyltransferase catalytic subunit [Lactobacillus sp. M0392]MBI0023258.1 aspartate carbamoyltransferase catalytic subunit [Lactobacillus sp. W8171]MBI0044622.1 aspartate carbamoyltransferase catalytic subunit [Lact